MKLSDGERGYLAGILDGEGSIMIYRNSSDAVARLVLQVVTTTNIMIFDRVCALLDKAGYQWRQTHWKGCAAKGWNQAWMAHLGRINDQRLFIDEIGPLVFGKAEHIRLASAFLRYRFGGQGGKRHVNRDSDDLIIASLKRLNARGKKLSAVETVREPADFRRKIQSELFGDEQSTAEMTVPLPMIQ